MLLLLLFRRGGSLMVPRGRPAAAGVWVGILGRQVRVREENLRRWKRLLLL